MSRSSDPRNFFQTSAAVSEEQRKEAKAKNASGSPIRLQSKLLAVIPDSSNDAGIFVAESAGTVRRLALNVDKPQKGVYSGPAAPLTSIALSADGSTLFSGCWDKTVWSWDVKSKAQKRRYAGHSDFVKCVVCTRITGGAEGGTVDVLVSGGQDAAVIVWDISTGDKLHILRGHTMGVLDLTIQPEESAASYLSRPASPSSFSLWSAGSDRSILAWHVSANSVKAIPFAASSTVQQSTSSATQEESQDKEVGQMVEPFLILHETSINRIRFATFSKELEIDEPGQSGSGEAIMMLTASSDKSVKLSSNVVDAGSTSQAESWKPTHTYTHPDFVRDLIAVPNSTGVLSQDECLIATACRDEEVRLWDASEDDTIEPLHVYSGHYEEVTGLAVRVVNNETVLVSVSIDATVRTWPASLEGIRRCQQEETEILRGDRDARPPDASEQSAAGAPQTLMTEEEERELAELMDDDDDDDDDD